MLTSTPSPEMRAAIDRKDLLAMQALAPLSSSYLPWSVSAMRPSGVVVVLNEIVVNRRRSIVELGGGVSTFYIGRLLQQRGGHLWTVEHGVEWADRLEQQLVAEGLGDVVTVVRSPLAQIPKGWLDEEATWYDGDKINEQIAGQSVDLLIVDGPPAYQPGKRHSRYPAAHFFSPMLADDYAIIVDDIDRVGEQDVIEAWEREFGLTFERRTVDGGVGIGRPGVAFTI